MMLVGCTDKASMSDNTCLLCELIQLQGGGLAEFWPQTLSITEAWQKFL